jgi:hypothetical protein
MLTLLLAANAEHNFEKKEVDLWEPRLSVVILSLTLKFVMASLFFGHTYTGCGRA